MILAKRISLIKDSPTFAVLAKANKMQKEGIDVIILAAGEPDFDTPKHIKDGAIKAIIDGKTKYTPVGGTLELKQAVVNKFKNENNLDYTINQVLVSNGGKHSIYNALQAIINEGDEVIIPAPYWTSYPDMVLLAGGSPIFISCSISEHYKLTAEKLRAAITKKTKAIFLNSPSNPTGMVYSNDELLAIAKVLEDYPDIFIISDDIYEHILFSNDKFSNIINVAPNLQSRTIIINGVSKAYSMTGWRIGFAACSNDAIIKSMEKIQSQSTSNPCSISQAAALTALTSGLECIKPMKEAFINRHDYVVNRINNIKGLKCLKSQGAFYAFFECSTAIERLYKAGKIKNNSDLELSNYLLDNFKVAGIPGSAFGLDEHMRFSFAANELELKRGLDRLENALI